MILERKQSVSTMRFCSFDQDNNVNQIGKRLPNEQENENGQYHDPEASPGIEDANSGNKLHELMYYSLPQVGKPSGVQLRGAGNNSNNKILGSGYKGSSPPADEKFASQQKNQRTSAGIRKKIEAISPTSGKVS